MKTLPRPIFADFETEEALARPTYPPVPVGCALLAPGERPEYLAWGHPIGNNCSKDFALRQLRRVWKQARHGDGLAFHHSKFDVAVGEETLGLPAMPWDQYHDTLFLAFLHDPHAASLELKPLGEKHLGLPPRERDALRDWLIKNVPHVGEASWSAHIAKAPGALTGTYACGDVRRTAGLFKFYWQDVIEKRGMRAAYDRERQLMPILLRTEREGFHVNLTRLRRDVARYTRTLADLDARIRRRLKAPNLDMSKGAQLADALDKAGVMKSWRTTPTGKRSTAKESLLEGIDDKRLLALLLYRGALATCLQTFMRPWLEVAEQTGGVVHTSWNQVRQPEEGGARTGRLSSSPNFQNIPTPTSPNYERLIKLLKEAGLLGQLAPFPMIRSYIAPDPGDLFLNRDYSQQELRILGHYEFSVLKDQYNADPWLDVHDLARTLINDMLGTDFSRRPIKDTGFGIIYGMGLEKLAYKTGQDRETAKRVKEAYLNIFPGLGDLDTELKWRGNSGQPIRTWGGREYYVEEPRYSKKFNRLQTFAYKLLNVLIQGSAADTTKQAIINYDSHPKRRARFLLTVHDEFLASCRPALLVPQMRVLREAMESVTFDVPMLSEGEYGLNWSNLKTFDEKGKELYRAH